MYVKCQIFLLLLGLFQLAYCNNEQELYSKSINEGPKLLIEKIDSLSKFNNTDNERFELAKHSLNISLESKNTFYICKSLTKLISHYVYSGEFSKAIELLNYLKYAAIKFKDQKLILETIYLYSIYYFENRQYELSLEYSKALLYFSKKYKRTEFLGKAYHSLATDYGMNGDVQLASQYCDSVLYYSNLTNDKGLELLYYINKYAFERALGNFEFSFSLTDLANKLMDSLKYTYYDVYIKEMKGTSYLDKHKYKEALQYYQQGLNIAIQSNNGHYEYLFYDRISFAYEFMGNIDSAYHYYILFKQLESKIINEENYLRTIESNNSVEKKLKNIEISKLSIANEALMQKRKVNFLLFGIFISVIVFLLIIALLLLKNTRFRKNALVELLEKNKKIELQSSVLAEQTKKISKFQSQMNPHFYANALNSLQGLILEKDFDRSIKQIQNISMLMRLTIINSEKDFIKLSDEVDYLNRYVDYMRENFKYNLDFKISISGAEDILLPPMIIQPLIENSFKHGKFNHIASPKILVKITTSDQFLIVDIVDNGLGFTDENITKKSHALELIKSRIQLLFEQENKTYSNDYFRINSTLNKGVVIHLKLPLIFQF